MKINALVMNRAKLVSTSRFQPPSHEQTQRANDLQKAYLSKWIRFILVWVGSSHQGLGPSNSHRVAVQVHLFESIAFGKSLSFFVSRQQTLQCEQAHARGVVRIQSSTERKRKCITSQVGK